MSPKEKARPKPGFDGGVPNHSELEPGGEVPHGLGGASEGGGASPRGGSFPKGSAMAARSHRVVQRDWLVDEGDGMNQDAKLARADGERVQTELTDGRIGTEEVMAAFAKIVLSWS